MTFYIDHAGFCSDPSLGRHLPAAVHTGVSDWSRSGHTSYRIAGISQGPPWLWDGFFWGAVCVGRKFQADCKYHLP